MLILTSKAPGFGKVKPRQYGPLSAVRSAVFRNAERLGIDPLKIGLYAPGWDGAGNARAIDGRNLTPGSTASWSKNRMLTAAAGNLNGRFYLDDYALPAGASQLTFLISDLSIVNRAASVFIAGQPSATDTNYDWGIYSSGSFTLETYVKTGGVAAKSVGGHTFTNGDNFGTLGLVYDGAELSTIKNGIKIGTVSKTGTLDRTRYFSLGCWANKTVGVAYGGLFVLNGALSVDQIAQLHETPYALFMPNPTPVFFDMAAGGGTVYTLYYDLRSAVSNEYAVQTDTKAAIATDLTALSDSRAAVSNDVTSQADTTTAIRTEVVSLADLKSAIANSLTVASDSQAAISNTLAVQADTKTAVSNALTSLADTKVQILNENTVVVSFDTLCQISNTLNVNSDTAARISNELATVADAKAAISTLLDRLTDTKTAASNEVTSLADTFTAISGLTVVVETFDTLCRISNELSSTADTRVSITVASDELILRESILLVSAITRQADLVSAITKSTTLTSPVDLQEV